MDIAVLEGNVHVQRLQGGASNENFLLTSEAGKFVFRLTAAAGERFGMDRAQGLSAHQRAAESGISPVLLGVLMPQGYCVTPFLDGRILDGQILREHGILQSCVQTLSIGHHATAIEGSFSAFADIRRYVNIASTEALPVPTDLISMTEAAAKVEMLFQAAETPSRLCHNDVQIQNFIIGEHKTWLLDWEFAGMGNPYFDLAMIASNGELGAEAQREVVATYFGQVRSADLARLRLMQFMSALREATWSVVAQPVLKGTGWDYQAWADLFFGRARTVLSSADFATDLTVGAPQNDDAAVFEWAAHNAAELQ